VFLKGIKIKAKYRHWPAQSGKKVYNSGK